MDGLMFPTDLAAWRSWQRRQNPLRRLRDLTRRAGPMTGWLGQRQDEPVVLAVVDAMTPTQLASVVRPALSLEPTTPTAVLAPQPLPDLDEVAGWRWVPMSDSLPDSLTTVRAVLSIGHHLPLAKLADDWADQHGLAKLVVQHGLLTPHAPPLPGGAHLLAFTASDGEFATAGRDDVTVEVVGSQLLWQASQRPAADTPAPDRAPIFLGQLHGSELARRLKVRAAEDICLRTGSHYRPHPAETDRLSVLQHHRWTRRGLVLDHTPTPLVELARPVVSIFSTGILEAAAHGLPAWAHCPTPPPWLVEFWQRYGIALWGGDPTPSPRQPDREPAATVAAHITDLIGASPDDH